MLPARPRFLPESRHVRPTSDGVEVDLEVEVDEGELEAELGTPHEAEATRQRAGGNLSPSIINDSPASVPPWNETGFRFRS